jgi:hypothetical protein
MANDASDPTALTYGEVRAALGRRATFEGHQEGVGTSPYYVLNVRPHSKRHAPFTLTGPDPTKLLRDALTRLEP